MEQFARDDSETAFTTLVERHVSLVHSVALRHTSDPQQAQDITQAVFILLARKAGSLGRKTVLSGWLYQTARLTAANWRRAEARRIRREQEAFMESTLEEARPEAVWSELSPLLDDAMSHLSATDRDAIVLRFFQNKTLPEVGSALGMEESAANKRVSRALEKLRKLFARRGVALTSVLIANAVAANSVNAAPAGLAATLASGATQSAAIAPAVTALVKGALKANFWMKLKLASSLGLGAALVCGLVTVGVSQGPGGDKRTPREIFTMMGEKYASLTRYSDDGTTVAYLNGMALTNTFSLKLARPNLYRIEWRQPLFGTVTSKGAAWSAGEGDVVLLGEQGPRKEPSMESALSTTTGVSSGAAANIPGMFFKMKWASQLGDWVGQNREADGRVGTVDCHVFSKELNGRTRTVWIGKQDLLIHQVETVVSSASMKAAMAEARRRQPEISTRPPKMEFTETRYMETHEHIVLDQPLPLSDYAR